MSYQNYEWEVIARDYNSPLSRNCFWVKSFFEQAEFFGIPRVVLGIRSVGNSMEYLLDKGATSWIAAHNALKEKVNQNPTWFEHHIDATRQKGEAMNEWTSQNIFEHDLTNITHRELLSLLVIGLEKMSEVYAFGIVLPILDFQGFSFVEGNLGQILKKYVSSEYQKWYEIFTFPIKNSFSQDQEEDLLRLYSRFWKNEAWKTDVQTKTLQQVQQLYTEFGSLLTVHANKHCWVYYVYAGPEFSEKQFFEFIKQYAEQGINPEQKLRDYEERKKYIEREKVNFFSTYTVTEFERAVLRVAGKMVWAKPRRKDYQSKSYFHLEKAQKEIGRRLGMTLQQVRSAPIEYLEKALRGEAVDHHLPNIIYEEHVCVPNDDGSVSILYGDEAAAFAATIIRHEEKADVNQKDVRGTCACPGEAMGVVRIINAPADIPKMQPGDILVSTATTPSIISAMKRAAAIVTDEGGLTCHAAIVSRELNIPCVIGTKIGTRVLRDGMMVRVDAAAGLILILK